MPCEVGDSFALHARHALAMVLRCVAVTWCWTVFDIRLLSLMIARASILKKRALATAHELDVEGGGFAEGGEGEQERHARDGIKSLCDASACI